MLDIFFHFAVGVAKDVAIDIVTDKAIDAVKEEFGFGKPEKKPAEKTGKWQLSWPRKKQGGNKSVWKKYWLWK